MRVVLLSPHRDDAAFSCGLVLNSFARAGAWVDIVNVCTVSDYAPYLAEDGRDRVSQVTSARRQEDEAFVLLLNRSSHGGDVTLIDLDWKDLPLRWNTRHEQALSPQPLREAEVAALAAAFRSLDEFDIALVPLALGGHLDHRLVRRAAEKAFDGSSVVFYEDLPYAARMTSAEREEAREAELTPLNATCAVFGQANLTDKREYALCYPSQIESVVADEMQQYTRAQGGERLFGSAEALDRLKMALEAAGVTA